MNPRCPALLHNHLPPKEQDPGSFILSCSIGKLDFKNALADLGASISIMPFSMYKCLGIGKLKPINMLLEMAHNTKCAPTGIVPIILEVHLLDTAHTQVDIFRKTISLEVGSKKVIFKMRTGFTTTNVESIRSIKSKTFIEDDNLKEIDYDLFLYDSESYLPINIEKHYWERNNNSKREELEWENLSLNDLMRIRYGKVCKMTRERILKDYWRERFGDEEDDLEENLEDPEECGEDKANTILGVIHDKLNNNWFNNTSEDEDDLEGILDYLKPISYDGFIDFDD
ncbi:hypothetical protein Tco_0149576 [Tanacetum coccineum]